MPTNPGSAGSKQSKKSPKSSAKKSPKNSGRKSVSNKSQDKNKAERDLPEEIIQEETFDAKFEPKLDDQVLFEKNIYTYILYLGN